VRLFATAALVASLLSTPAAPASDGQSASLDTYLASISWPVRLSVQRVNRVRTLIDGWIAQGDPPYLGEIAQECRKVRSLRAGTFAAIVPPAELRTFHGRLASAFVRAHARCKTVRRLALAARDEVRGPNDPPSATLIRARHELRRFVDTTLEGFDLEVHAWRMAVLHYASTHALSAPEWVKLLG
jgi:hypothetical protein